MFESRLPITISFEVDSFLEDEDEMRNILDLTLSGILNHMMVTN